MLRIGLFFFSASFHKISNSQIFISKGEQANIIEYNIFLLNLVY